MSLAPPNDAASPTLTTPGRRLVHPRAGIELRILQSGTDTGGELLEMEATYPPASAAPPVHFHPRQTEKFLVLAGSLHAKIDGELRRLEAGDTLEVPAGTRHTMWNPGPGPAKTNWQTRPALRTQEFFTDLFALAAQGRVDARGRPHLLELAIFVPRYWQEMRVTRPSPLVQRLLFAILAPVSRRLGRSRW